MLNLTFNERYALEWAIIKAGVRNLTRATKRGVVIYF